MQKFYSQRQEMQIPQENTYKGLEIMRNFDAEFEILSKNYIINKKNELTKYIKKHDFKIFMIYRIVLAVIVLLYLLIGV